MPAVSNTSPISNLACIGRLNLLHEQFSELWIPPAVDSELRDLPNSIARKLISDAKRAGLIQRWPDIANTKLVSLLMLELHRGEAEAIALALETKTDHLLIDERDGRLMARQLGLSLTGVLGVLLRAKKMKQIKAIKPEIAALKNKAHFFIAPDVESAILKRARE